MYSYSLDKLEFTSSNSGEYLRNIFQKTVVDNKEIETYTTIVKEEEAMRIDRICDRIYGTTRFVEELMVLNNIINPWSINAGDEFVYFALREEEKMHEFDPESTKTATKEKLANPNKNTRKDPNRSDNLTPTIKPKNMKSLDVNKENHKIKIINKLG